MIFKPSVFSWSALPYFIGLGFFSTFGGFILYSLLFQTGHKYGSVMTILPVYLIVMAIYTGVTPLFNSVHISSTTIKIKRLWAKDTTLSLDQITEISYEKSEGFPRTLHILLKNRPKDLPLTVDLGSWNDKEVGKLLEFIKKSNPDISVKAYRSLGFTK